MNLKLRFALLFTSFVAIILFLSCITIYFLFSNSREEDYFQHMSKEGQEVYNIFNDVKRKDPAEAYRLINEIHDKSLYKEALFILDSTGNVLFRFPDSLHTFMQFVPFAKLRDGQTYRLADNNNIQRIAMYMPDTKSYVFVSGYDWQGYQKLKNLEIILVFVFLGALLLSAVISFVFVKEAVRPLKELGDQMQKTTVQNLTERVRASDAKDEINEIARNFNAMLERLSKAFEFQKSFVYHASHELRTPLATMLSETESALHKPLAGAEYEDVLLSLKEEQQELIELTNSLLLISQYEYIGYGEEWPRIRIDEVLYEAVSTSKKSFSDLVVNIAFANLPEADDEFTIRGNETLLKAAFSNLIKNAYTYSHDQKVSITMDTEGDTILIHLDNKGAQLPADDTKNIMVPFFRGGNALKTKGYGLGLSIVYRFIAVHKGSIAYTPVSDDTIRFTVTLKKASAVDKKA